MFMIVQKISNKVKKIPVLYLRDLKKSWRHVFPGGKAAEERPRICVNLAICTKIISGFSKYSDMYQLLMHRKCCLIHCPINYQLAFSLLTF